MMRKFFGKVVSILWVHIKILLILAIIIGAAAGVLWGVRAGWHNAQVVWYDPVWRSLVVSIVAHHRAGDPIPFDPDYGRTENIVDHFGIVTNSKWLGDKTRLIIPYFFYEGVIRVPQYPRTVVFAPNVGMRSFHVAGTYRPDKEVVLINERSILSESDYWNDEAAVLSTLVHELIHNQGQVFITGDSEEFEPATVAATLEVLAAMCNHNDDVACRAFWSDVESMTRAIIRVRLKENRLDWLYEFMSDVLYRSPDNRIYSEKTLRFWENNQDQLMYILRAYSLTPWNKHIKPGVYCGKAMITVAPDSRISWFGQISSSTTMKFDDTSILLGPFGKLLFVIRCY